jgi:hypothetical protein
LLYRKELKRKMNLDSRGPMRRRGPKATVKKKVSDDLFCLQDGRDLEMFKFCWE